jgi:hypothetical protein
MITIKVTANDPSEGMMLREVAQFVEEIKRNGGDNDTRVKARVGMRGQLRSLETRP